MGWGGGWGWGWGGRGGVGCVGVGCVGVGGVGVGVGWRVGGGGVGVGVGGVGGWGGVGCHKWPVMRLPPFISLWRNVKPVMLKFYSEHNHITALFSAKPQEDSVILDFVSIGHVS